MKLVPRPLRCSALPAPSHAAHAVRPLCAALGLWTLAMTGCNSTSEVTTTPINTSLRIDPDSFLGAVGCLDEPGGRVGSYSATLTHLEAASSARPGDGIHSGVTAALPSSPPVACHLGVTFEARENDQADDLGVLRGGEHYVAEIRAYEAPACGSPLGLGDAGGGGCLRAEGPGVPVAVDELGMVVEPRWTARCGIAPEDVLRVGELLDGGIELVPDAGATPYWGAAYRGDLRPLWTTAQTGRALRMQGCVPLE